MTKQVTCTYPGDREGAIIDYVYGESDAADRIAFERHVASCLVCRAELDAYRGVRRALAEWAPPEPVRTPERAPLPTGPRLAMTPFSVNASLSNDAPQARAVAATHRVSLPTWARAAVAALCVGVGLGAANLRVSYSPAGLTVRSGWMQDAPAAPRLDADAEPWRAELAAVADQLRREMASREAQGAGAPGGRVQVDAPAEDLQADVLKHVRTLLARSEQRQQRELALRVGDLLNDVQVQRRADLARIDRAIGAMQSSTGMDLLRQREAINTLAVRVSGQR